MLGNFPSFCCGSLALASGCSGAQYCSDESLNSLLLNQLLKKLLYQILSSSRAQTNNLKSVEDNSGIKNIDLIDPLVYA